MIKNTRGKNIIFYIVSVVFGIAIFTCLGGIWVRNTFGELLIATTDVYFRNWLENKRSLFLMQVCIPTACSWGVAMLIAVLLDKKIERIKTKWVSSIFVLLSVVLIIVGGSCLKVGDYVKRQVYLGREQWYDESRVVIHALGEIGGRAYTNSQEALEKNYGDGNKVFECDVILTADKKLVAAHDWNTGFHEGFSKEDPPTKQEFMQTPIIGKYTPMSIEEIVRFMKEHPEVYIVTDSKSTEEEEYKIEFRELVNAAMENDCEDVLKRFVIQIYHPYMYHDIESIYDFENYIFTLYREGYRGDTEEMEEYARFCVLNGIDVITINKDYYNDELPEICDRYGLQLFVHTVNGEERTAFLEKNVGIYTDSYTE